MASAWSIVDVERIAGVSSTIRGLAWLPSRERREAVEVGDFVKLIFRHVNPTVAIAERVWFRVVEQLDAQRWRAELVSNPELLEVPMAAEFGPEHVAELETRAGAFVGGRS